MDGPSIFGVGSVWGGPVRRQSCSARKRYDRFICDVQICARLSSPQLAAIRVKVPFKAAYA